MSEHDEHSHDQTPQGPISRTRASILLSHPVDQHSPNQLAVVIEVVCQKCQVSQTYHLLGPHLQPILEAIQLAIQQYPALAQPHATELSRTAHLITTDIPDGRPS